MHQEVQVNSFFFLFLSMSMLFLPIAVQSEDQTRMMSEFFDPESPSLPAKLFYEVSPFSENNIPDLTSHIGLLNWTVGIPASWWNLNRSFAIGVDLNVVLSKGGNRVVEFLADVLLVVYNTIIAIPGNTIWQNTAVRVETYQIPENVPYVGGDTVYNAYLRSAIELIAPILGGVLIGAYFFLLYIAGQFLLTRG